MKSQMLQGILQVLLTIMASSQGEDNEDDDMLGEEELGTQSPGSCAAQVSHTTTKPSFVYCLQSLRDIKFAFFMVKLAKCEFYP